MLDWVKAHFHPEAQNGIIPLSLKIANTINWTLPYFTGRKIFHNNYLRPYRSRKTHGCAGAHSLDKMYAPIRFHRCALRTFPSHGSMHSPLGGAWQLSVGLISISCISRDTRGYAVYLSIQNITTRYPPTFLKGYLHPNPSPLGQSTPRPPKSAAGKKNEKLKKIWI